MTYRGSSHRGSKGFKITISRASLTPCRMAPTVAAASLQADISALLEDLQGADFALHCEGETVMAHSFILAARSE
jgi:hypothetical protein